MKGDLPSIDSLLCCGRDHDTAIYASECPPLTYATLRTVVAETGRALRGFGIGRADRVAVVLPNGPEMAVAFTAIVANATIAPLNPAYKPDEFEFYLTDLRAKALVIGADDDSPARRVAETLGVGIIELRKDSTRGAGAFRLSGRPSPLPESAAGSASPGDTCLILHTSGTTSRPKIVPLSQENVTVSALNIATTLRLSPSDRALNIMPLFHIHGLIAGVLAPLASGGAVFCTPGFNALRFFSWMDEARPTWYTGVPTMHQSILGRARHNGDVIARNPMRFVRSSSAAIHPQIIGSLEDAFSAPLIEAYGMTEAAHQMASNPLPPLPRVPGSVGLAAGPEIAIVAEDGSFLPDGGTGEIVIRGRNVMRAYENSPEANARAFIADWFRTGDQGVRDDRGYLRVTGRLKEIINRGGEKVSPLEVDEALMNHPEVAQAVTFAVPHRSLGEDVAAAVVLRDGSKANAEQLREFVALRLASFKVPRVIRIVEEIPKGATGKLQRIGLAARLGLAESDEPRK